MHRMTPARLGAGTPSGAVRTRFHDARPKRKNLNDRNTVAHRNRFPLASAGRVPTGGHPLQVEVGARAPPRARARSTRPCLADDHSGGPVHAKRDAKLQGRNGILRVRSRLPLHPRFPLPHDFHVFRSRVRRGYPAARTHSRRQFPPQPQDADACRAARGRPGSTVVSTSDFVDWADALGRSDRRKERGPK